MSNDDTTSREKQGEDKDTWNLNLGFSFGSPPVPRDPGAAELGEQAKHDAAEATGTSGLSFQLADGKLRLGVKDH